MRFEGREFRGQTLLLVGNEFVRCTIIGCLLRYSGTTEIHLAECRMGGNEFSYDGHAANTVRALQALARSGGGGLDHVMRLFLAGAPVDWHGLAEIARLPTLPDEPR